MYAVGTMCMCIHFSFEVRAAARAALRAIEGSEFLLGRERPPIGDEDEPL